MKILLMYKPHAAHAQALREAAPDAEFCCAMGEAEAQALVVDADAILGNRYFLQALPFARRLRWMQSNSVGMDLVLSRRDLLTGVTITNARGVYDDELADHALALILGLARKLHLARDAQHEGEWNKLPLLTLRGCSALILGWGGVGRGIADRLRAFGVRIAALRRSHSGPPAQDRDGVTIYGPETWRAALPETDFLVIALPLTAATHGLVGAAELHLLKPGACVVNVARGPIIDEMALFTGLRRGKIAGAGLDVLNAEPPPPDHPVWTTPNALLTPHVARSPETEPRKWEALFVENVRRFANGLPLLNVVDKDAGY